MSLKAIDQKTGRFVRIISDKQCPVCSVVFRPRMSKQQVCSKKCLKYFLKANKTSFKKGQVPWNKGINIWNTRSHPRGMLGKIAWNRGKHWSSEIKNKQSFSHKGVRLSPETCAKMSIAKTGVQFSEETKKKISLKKIGKKLSNETKEKLRIANLGKKHTEETKNKIRLSNKEFYDKKGRMTPINTLFRQSFEYKQWRSNVFQRDEWTCQTCGIKGGELEVHHIKSFSKFPELRLVENNGVTLCHECHKLTDNYLKNI